MAEGGKRRKAANCVLLPFSAVPDANTTYGTRLGGQEGRREGKREGRREGRQAKCVAKFANSAPFAAAGQIFAILRRFNFRAREMKRVVARSVGHAQHVHFTG